MANLLVSQSKAIYAALKAGVPLATEVYDLAAKENPTFPYIVLGTASTNNVRTFNNDMYDHTIIIHVYSRRRGKGEILAIYEQIKLLLHRTRLILEGSMNYQLYGKVRLVDVLVEPDRQTMHGIIFYESLLNG